MNLNQGMMFVPGNGGQPATPNMMIPGGAGGAGGAHFMGGPPPPHPHGHPNAMYHHMRQMMNFPRFMGQSPPQRSGFSYYHHHHHQQQQHHHQAGPRHFYNPPPPGMMMNHSRSPLQNNIFSHGGIWTNSKHNFPPIQGGSPPRNCNQPKDNVNAEPTTSETAKTATTTMENETTKEQNASNETPKGEHNKQQSQPQQSVKKSDKIDKVLNKSLTKLPKIKRADSKLANKKTTTAAATLVVAEAVATVTSSAAATTGKISSASISTTTMSTAATCVKIINKDMKQREQQKKKNDTMQRNSSKASHASLSSPTTSNHNNQNKSHSKDHHHHHQSSSHISSSTSGHGKNSNHDSSDSGISTGSGHQHHANSSSATSKQRKSRGNNKRQDGTSNAGNSTATNGSGQQQQQKQQQQQRGAASTAFTVNDWLQNDLYCYERRRYLASCGEDSMIASRHNPAHRNSTSSEAAGSDDLNTSSSNEDLSSAYIVQNKAANKKSSKSRQKRQQKRKQNNNHSNGTGASASSNTNGSHKNNSSDLLQPMDIDEEYKENHKPLGAKQSHNNNTNSTAAINLRKQCTKAAALKAVLNNSKLGKLGTPGVNALTTSPSNSSVCSSLSSASSTTSISSSSLSSSASSSPAHSANSSPTASPTASKRNAEHLKKVAQALAPPPLRQFVKLNLSESELVQQMRRYVVDPSLLRVYGFPVESVHHEGCIEIYKCLPKHLAEEAVTKDNQRHHRHYYGRKKSSVINSYDGLSSSQQWSNSSTAIDSGHGSGDSSPRFTDSDSSEMGEDDMTCGLETENPPVMAFYTPDGVYQIFSEYDNSVEKQCVRCSKMFEVNSEGEYLTFEPCTYHWGKANNVYNGKCYVNIYSCCQGEESSEGCSQHPLHVWNGAVVGINGPYSDFVHTRPRSEKQKNRHPKIYAIDCEMSYTGLGLEVTKVTVVGYDGSLVYEHFVRPQAEIIDYNTRFSGITEKDLSPDSNNSIKTFAQVQQDLLKLFDADTILIGHGLDNDLRVLRLVHKTIVDTSLIFSHSTGYPYRRSLKNLTKSFLKRDIQCSDSGHSSFEDSRACLELMLWKVRKDLRHWSYQ
ncbi:midnolin homolog isoform X1 [Musca domestica]|uniref:Midnolin homolog isoform X1 n=2 Tax=Musca domestica TaxID=7370 RepID=A0A1I8MAH2_MUSDO|nr:midnolin homolog isoform X1 [Musca domestica]XP_058978124.1 midnolin homolog isoform X1 [Musca domestica]